MANLRSTRTFLRTRMLGALRAGLLLAAMVFGSLFFFLRSAKAHVGEQLAHFGVELMAWHETEVHGITRELFLNGLEIRLVTASTPLSVPEALGRFHTLCRERGGIERPDTRLNATAPSGPALPVLDGVLAWESDTEGVLACLDTGRPLGVAELIVRAQRFGATGDLSALGELRYVVARRSGATTTLLVLWTEGATPVLRAFPKTGDAPGTDPMGVPRPEKGRRLLSAAEQGAPYSVTTYAVDADPADLAGWYARELAHQGWVVTRRPGVLVARQSGRVIAVRVATAHSGETVASVIELA